MPTDAVPRLFAGLVDDAAFTPGGWSHRAGSCGGGPLAEAVTAHRAHRAAWYAALVGPLIVPASSLPALPAVPASALPAVLDGKGEPLAVGVIGDTRTEAIARFIGVTGGGVKIAHVEALVARRGEDPQPGLRRFVDLLRGLPSARGYAEIPLTWGLLAALDTLVEARASGVPVWAKFRTGGLAAELFPTPVELAAVICACRDRHLRFKLTTGLGRAVRHTDPETGFVHHGFLNVVVAATVAARGAEVPEVAEILAATDPVALAERAWTVRDHIRPLWDGFAVPDVAGPLAELRHLDLVVDQSM